MDFAMLSRGVDPPAAVNDPDNVRIKLEELDDDDDDDDEEDPHESFIRPIKQENDDDDDDDDDSDSDDDEMEEEEQQQQQLQQEEAAPAEEEAVEEEEEGDEEAAAAAADDDDDDDDDQEDGEEVDNEVDKAIPKLGGKIDKKAYCLLDGIVEQKDGRQQRITIPLTRLPAVLGRSHTTGDTNFFSLGPAKALSRQHCIIDYRVGGGESGEGGGGKLVTPKSASRDSPEEEQLDYEKGNPLSAAAAGGKALQEDDNDKEDNNNTPKTIAGQQKIPFRGAFVLESLGKNLIMVGSQRIRQGEVAVLSSGTPIRMSTYSLYFLLPTDTADPPKTMDIPIDDATTNNNTTTTTKSPSPPKKQQQMGGNKRKMPSSSSSSPPGGGGAQPPAQPDSSSSSLHHNKPKVKKPKAAPFAQLQAELDALPIDTLLDRMNEAVDSERWERKHQLIGSTISLHAVRDATSAASIREQAADGGVARTEIMKWIRESPKYATWVEQMMSKMEAKSYQNTITKALLKAGNVRTGSGGRYIKWILRGVKLKKPVKINDEDIHNKDSTMTEGLAALNGDDFTDHQKTTDPSMSKDPKGGAAKDGNGEEEEEEGEEDGEGDDEDGEDENDDEDDHEGDENEEANENASDQDGEGGVDAGAEGEHSDSDDDNEGEEANDDSDDDEGGEEDHGNLPQESSDDDESDTDQGGDD